MARRPSSRGLRTPLSRPTSTIGGTVKITGAQELLAEIQKMDAAMQGSIARGAIGEAANVVRDLAQNIAAGQGLAETGQVVTPAGNTIERRGQIPNAIFAVVEKPRKASQHARVFVDPSISEKGRDDRGRHVAHWVYPEFGNVNTPARPFMRPALLAGAEPAVNAALEVIERKVRSFNKKA